MPVSVVIPCYNSLEFLPETLTSVLAQELPTHLATGFEVVLVDDGGSDDLAKWAEHLGDQRVRVIRQENAGVSAARNLGIATARGDLIAFCDSDDLWTPSTVAALAGCFEHDSSIGMAYGWYDVVDGEGKPNGRVVTSDASGDVWEQFVLRNPVSASGVMVRREAFDTVGDFAVNRDRFRIDVEDWEMWIRIASEFRVGLARQLVAHHRRHGSNSSTDVESLDAAYRHMFDVVFEEVTPERAALRPEATARSEMILGWQSLNDRQDPKAALRYLKQATGNFPEIRRSAEYWRLKIAASALAVTGPLGYGAMRSLNSAARRLLRASSVQQQS